MGWTAGSGKELSIKDFEVETVCPVRTFCGQSGFFKYGRSHFLVKKHRILKNLWCVPHVGGGGLIQCGHFVDKGSGVKFLQFFCERLLWTVP